MSTWSTYQKPNTGLLFYKHIYKEKPITDRLVINEKRELVIDIGGNDRSPFDEYYDDLITVKAGDFEQIENAAHNQSFTLFTTYPGLLTGSGYQHDTKAKGDFKIGFFFDHTSGQPVIPGSSVKGILRSLFEQDIPVKGNTFSGQKSVDAIRFICDEIIESAESDENMRAQWESIKTKIAIETLDALKINIFGDDGEGKAMGTDIFFDAVLNLAQTGADRRIFSKDFITPHHDPLKNPVPLQFLKVLPNVGFDFKFILHDAGEWTVEIKMVLFKQILLTLGAGAKTNVGYGQFSTSQSVQSQQQQPAAPVEENRQRPPGISILDELTEPSPDVKAKLTADSDWPAQVYMVKGNNCLICIPVDGEQVILKKKLDKIGFEVKEGDEVTVIFIAKYTFDSPQFKVTKPS